MDLWENGGHLNDQGSPEAAEEKTKTTIEVERMAVKDLRYLSYGGIRLLCVELLCLTACMDIPFIGQEYWSPSYLWTRGQVSFIEALIPS